MDALPIHCLCELCTNIYVLYLNLWNVHLTSVWSVFMQVWGIWAGTGSLFFVDINSYDLAVSTFPWRWLDDLMANCGNFKTIYKSMYFIYQIFFFIVSPPYRTFGMAVVVSTAKENSVTGCSPNLYRYILGYIVILCTCLVVEGWIIYLSLKGTIFYVRPRKYIAYLLYARIGKRQGKPFFSHCARRHLAGKTSCISVPWTCITQTLKCGI